MIPLRASLADDEEDLENPPDPEEWRQAQRAYRFRNLIAHLSGSRDWPRLFELVEQRGFLADQADWFGGFERPGEDVEEHVLRAAIEARDWERFVRFAAVAANLRALAEDLVDPDILRALAAGERVALARDLAARLTNPVARGEAHAVIATACRRDHLVFGDLLHAISRDLQAAEATEGRSPIPSLASIARQLGPELDTLWPSCIPRLAPAPGDADLVWQAVAAAWLNQSDIKAPGLWRALAEIREPRRILEVAPERLADLGPEDPAEILDKLCSLLGADENVRRWAVSLFLGRLAESRPEEALAAWEGWTKSEAIPWSAALVEACRGVIVRLDPDRLEELCASIDDVSARAALRIVDLESRLDERRAASALAVLQEAPDDCLHWSLRYAASGAPEPEDELRRKLGSIAGYLYELRYEADPRDLRLFLDLVARLRPDELKAHLEGVVWSPASNPETLLTLASETESERLAELLLENAERYAAAVAPTAVEGFQLRKDLLIRIAASLCSFRGNTQILDDAIGRLLPEEEDELRTVLAPRLQSREIAEGIHDRRRRLLTLLETIPPGDANRDLLAARSLYAAVARVDAIEDELRGLATLLQVPLDLSDLADNQIGAIRDPGIRLQALLRLAWHSIAFQESFYGGRPDRTAAIEMVRSAFTADTDARLVGLTPQVAELGAQVGGARAVAELQEAVRRLVRLDSVSWQERLEALERLLACIPSLFLRPGDRRNSKLAAEVLEAVARLPFQSNAGAAQEEIQSRWHEVLPIVVTVLDRLPDKPAMRVRRILQSVLSFPLPPVQKRVFELCVLPPEERLREIDRRLREPDLDPEGARAIPYLLAARASERVSAALERLPADAERDSSVLRLARNGWLPCEQITALQPLLSSPEARQRLEVWSSQDAETWCSALAGLSARGEVDPAAPGDEPLLRRLWQRPSPESLQILARSVLDALRTGGRQRGEAALRLWLHAWLAPKLGAAQREPQRLAEGLGSSLRLALELAPAGQPKA